VINNPEQYDLKSQSLNNYSYDALGQMTENAAEDIKYTYNTQGLVTGIRKRSNNNLIVAMVYNERGQRIQKNAYNSTTGALLSSDYYVLDLAGNTMAVPKFH
jgi:YD repeat-containing protein